MKFINYLQSISGIGVYPLLSLFIFLGFFLFVGIYVMTKEKKYFEEVSRIPLDNHSTDFNYEH